MSTAKVALKAAKAALDAHQYDEAVKQAEKVLELDPKNYHALVLILGYLFMELKGYRHVFLGLALDKQDKVDKSEKVYGRATDIKPKDPLVWQGLITLYEKQAGKKLNEYRTAAIQLAEIFMGLYVARIRYLET